VNELSLQALAHRHHTNPHSVLGVHLQADGRPMFRVLRPDADAVTVLLGQKRLPLLPSLGVEGLFEGVGEGAVPPTPPLLEIASKRGETVVTADAYCFWPTIGDIDLHLFGEGRHWRLWEMLGARLMTHQGIEGAAFALWAPNARGVAVVGDFNRWDARVHPMRNLGHSGVWELFIPGVGEGQHYKFEVLPQSGPATLKADPMARRTEVPPRTASRIEGPSTHVWRDADWVTRRASHNADTAPISIYEVHLGSYRPELTSYQALAEAIAGHAGGLGFTHVELLPVAEHPFGGSWGYQVTSYYAPTSRFGSPDDFRAFVDILHQRGLGVIVDFVPAHFPRDPFALAQFDGTALYEHADPRMGAHPDWGTLVFNFGRHEVRNFLIASALYWLESFHLDGLRVDAVASMLYRDYSRSADQWVPNRHGGRENEEAVYFLRLLNDVTAQRYPGTLVTAEESTAWAGVSRSTDSGGLGFAHKWNMGWMHDTLKYFSVDPLYRKHHHNQLSFGLMYQYTERFMLPLSHDEVVHGKQSLLSKMPGDDWQKFANLRALYGWMWAHPGKKLLFMGGELGQWNEWNHDAGIDWHLGTYGPHQGLLSLVGALNHLYRREGALHEGDFWPQGFQWVSVDEADLNVFAFLRRGQRAFREILVVANMNPMVREHRVGVPSGGWWQELLSTDECRFGGSGVTNAPRKAEPHPWQGQPGSVVLKLPPLGISFWAPTDPPSGH
jgi:1,4-alpha-glucan branching enzyme